MTSSYKYGYLSCNNCFPMTFTYRITSIHMKDTHRITSIHIKDTHRITSIHIYISHKQQATEVPFRLGEKKAWIRNPTTCWSAYRFKMYVETCTPTWLLFKISKRNWTVWGFVSAPLSDLENVLQLLLQYVPQSNLSSEPNSLQKFNSFLKYLRTSPGFQLKLK